MALFLATLDELKVEGAARVSMVKATDDEKKKEIIMHYQKLQERRGVNPERGDSLLHTKSAAVPASFTHGL
jgi:hypothetical protein